MLVKNPTAIQILKEMGLDISSVLKYKYTDQEILDLFLVEIRCLKARLKNAKDVYRKMSATIAALRELDPPEKWKLKTPVKAPPDFQREYYDYLRARDDARRESENGTPHEHLKSQDSSQDAL